MDSSKSAPEIVFEVPNNLKQLARVVTYNFFSLECVLLVDMLIRNTCMKEDDLCELLRFDKKVLRSRIATLRADRIVTWRIKMETGADNKTQRIYHYFINYKSLVRSVKFKLDRMRDFLEADSRKKITNAVFNCMGCPATYTDLDIDRIYDFSLESLRCYTCHSLVKENIYERSDARSLFAKFNQQMEVIYELIRSLCHVRLAPEILDPPVADMRSIRGIDATPTEMMKRLNGSEMKDLISVNLNKSSNESETDIKEKKEVPKWLLNDEPNKSLSLGCTVSNSSKEFGLEIPNAKTAADNPVKYDEIIAMLLKYETKAQQPLFISNKDDDSDSDSSTDWLDGFTNSQKKDTKYKKNDPAAKTEGQDKTDDESDESMNMEQTPEVFVSGLPYSMEDVTPELIREMSSKEKEDYINKYAIYWSDLV